MPHDDQQLLSWVPRLRRYARALAGNREDADDLVQDTLERAWKRSALWPGVGDMRSWLFSIMHNVHVDRVRRPRVATVDLDEQAPEVPVPAAQGDRLAVLDLQAALDGMAATDVNARWQAEMAEFFESLDGRRPDEAFQTLREVFHLA